MQILVVEDDTKLAELLKRLLEMFGYQVQLAGSGKVALDLTSAKRPNLVILDLRLPDMDGYEVCHRLRNRYDTYELPVLMLTAMDKPIDKLRGFASGANAYITKPYDSSDLLETVTTLLDRTKRA